MTTTATTLPLNKLRIDPMNVRKHRDEIAPEMLATIRANGIIQALQVRPNSDGHAVFAGGDRLRCLQALAKEGAIPADHPVKVEIHDITDAEARERSLIENFARSDMHPVDEYRAFVGMRADKEQPLDAEQIAARFGLDVLHVRQRLALGALDDAILDAWIAGQINEDAAQAFTLCPSKKAQVAIFKKLSKDGHVGAFSIKRELKGEAESAGKYLAFVGKDAYEARGGKVTEDLFGTDHIVSDAALMTAMVAEKTEELCKQLVEAGGWAWAVMEPKDSYNYGHMEGKAKPPKELAEKLAKAQKALDALQEKDEYDYEDEDKLQDEIAAIEQLIAPHIFTDEQKKKAGCFVSLNNKGEAEIEFGRVMPSEKRAAAASERKADKGGSAAAAAPKPSEAKVISNALASRLNEQLTEATKKALKTDKAAEGLPTILKNLVAGMIGGYGTPHAVEKALPAIRDAITPKVMNEAICKEFKRDDYFGNAPIPVLLAAITDAVGAEQAKKLKGKKKSELAKFALANVAKTDWLPKEMRTANYDGPGAVKGKTPASKSK